MNSLTANLIEKYRQNRTAQGLSADTVDRVATTVSLLLRDTGGTITTITTDTVLEWGTYRQLQGKARSTIYAYYNAIRMFINFLNENNIKHYLKPELIRCKPHYKRRVTLLPSEIRQVLEFADSQTRLLMRLIYTSGMRISEAIQLTEKHLSSGTTMFVRSKGGDERPIVITSELHKQLVSQASVNGGFCFTDTSGVQLSRKKAYYKIKTAMIRAGFPFAYPHSLRHAFATELLRKGVSLSHVQRLMGHSSVAVTQIYEHLLTADIEKAHRKMEKI